MQYSSDSLTNTLRLYLTACELTYFDNYKKHDCCYDRAITASFMVIKPSDWTTNYYVIS